MKKALLVLILFLLVSLVYSALMVFFSTEPGIEQASNDNFYPNITQSNEFIEELYHRLLRGAGLGSSILPDREV